MVVDETLELGKRVASGWDRELRDDLDLLGQQADAAGGDLVS